MTASGQISWLTPVCTRPKPQTTLYRGTLTRYWSRNSMASGLVNFENTCFMNSVFQCLQHVPSFNSYLTKHHRLQCTSSDSSECVACVMSRLADSCFSSDSPVEPIELVVNLGSVAKHMSLGKQEDAHDFLQCLFDRLQEAFTSGLEPKPDQYQEMTTVVGQIFGGFLKNEVLCLACEESKCSFESMLTLSLNVVGFDSLVSALDGFFGQDKMEGEASFDCESCGMKRLAVKTYTLDEAPESLIIHLKRYDGSSKLTHPVTVESTLDLTKYIARTSAAAPKTKVVYELASVIVHRGEGVGSGHYVAYVSDPSSMQEGYQRIWYEMNDSSVEVATWDEVASCQAYLLFYVRKDCILSFDDTVLSSSTCFSLSRRRNSSSSSFSNSTSDPDFTLDSSWPTPSETRGNNRRNGLVMRGKKRKQ